MKFVKPTNVQNQAVGYDLKNRVLPRTVSSGSSRGTQTVGYGNTKIDGSNNRIVIDNPTDGTQINVGVTPDTDGNLSGFGLSVVDSDGFTLFELDGETWFWYDKTTGKNVMQVGKLPDGSYGTAVAKNNQDVADGF